MPTPSQAIDFTPQVGIDKTFQKGVPYAIPKSTKAIGEYVRAIYKYAIGIVGILASVVLMFGGILWIVAGGNAERVGNAKSWIGASLTGLILVLCSYTILKTVNPNLVSFQPIGIKKVDNNSSKDEKCPYGEIVHYELSGSSPTQKCINKCNGIDNKLLYKIEGSETDYCCNCGSGYCQMSNGECIPVAKKIEDCKNKGGKAFCSDKDCNISCSYFIQ
jgi:hypothetical protein